MGGCNEGLGVVREERSTVPSSAEYIGQAYILSIRIACSASDTRVGSMAQKSFPLMLGRGWQRCGGLDIWEAGFLFQFMVSRPLPRAVIVDNG